MIEYAVLLAACHKGEASQVHQHSPGAILAIEPEQGAFSRELMRCKIPTDGREALTQFLAVASVASIAKTAEPTFNCGPD